MSCVHLCGAPASAFSTASCTSIQCALLSERVLLRTLVDRKSGESAPDPAPLSWHCTSTAQLE